MTRTQAVLLTVTAVLLAAWIVRGVTRMPPEARATGGSSAHVAERLFPADVAERAAALRAIDSAPRAFRAVRRNPFEFRGAAPVAVAPALAAADSPAEPPVPARPDMVLSGIAEDAGPGGPSRTAVIATLGQVFLAREGDRLLSRFLVLRVSADAVQFRDGQVGDVFTLALK